jgi:hypothetical protein
MCAKSSRKTPKAGGANAIVVIGRQAIKVFGREEVVMLDVRHRHSFHEDLGAPKVKGLLPPPARIRLTCLKQRTQPCVIHVPDKRTELEISLASKTDMIFAIPLPCTSGQFQFAPDKGVTKPCGLGSSKGNPATNLGICSARQQRSIFPLLYVLDFSPQAFTAKTRHRRPGAVSVTPKSADG